MADVNILGIFRQESPVHQAIDALHQAGFGDNQITVLSHRSELAELTTSGFQSFLSSIGLSQLDTTNVRQSLVDLGVDALQAEQIDRRIGDDGAVVAVHPDGRREEALSILNRFTAEGMPGTMEGRTTTEEIPTAGTMAEPATERPTTPVGATTEGERTMELHGEELEVQKHREQVGEVVAHKEVVTEHRTIEVPIRREEVVVERRPIPEGEREAAPGTRIGEGEGEEIRVPVSEEHVEVEKRPVVREEVTVGKRATEEEKRVEGTVREEELRVEKEGKADVHKSGERKD
jgi:uncharacterized protein (TIGR02271 family)